MKRIGKLLAGVGLCLLVSTSAFAGGWFSFGFNSGGRPRCHPSCGGYGYSYCAPPAYYYYPPPVVTYRYYYSPPAYYYSGGSYYCR